MVDSLVTGDHSSCGDFENPHGPCVKASKWMSRFMNADCSLMARSSKVRTRADHLPRLKSHFKHFGSLAHASTKTWTEGITSHLASFLDDDPHRKEMQKHKQALSGVNGQDNYSILCPCTTTLHYGTKKDLIDRRDAVSNLVSRYHELRIPGPSPKTFVDDRYVMRDLVATFPEVLKNDIKNGTLPGGKSGPKEHPPSCSSSISDGAQRSEERQQQSG